MTTILVLILVLTSDGKPVTKALVEVEGDQQTNYYVEGVKQPEHVWVEKATDSRGMFIVEVEPGLHRVVIRLKEGILYERDVTFVKGRDLQITVGPDWTSDGGYPHPRWDTWEDE